MKEEDAVTDESIVEIQGVSRTYGSGELAVHALRDVDLDIHAGDFAAVAGPSGSGKTTLLNVMSGLDRPTEGTVVVDGSRLNDMSGSELSRLRAERIGFVFQAYNLLPVLTAFENAEYVLMLQGVSTAARRKKVMEVLERVGLVEMADRFPHELSGGQQQRVAVARAIAAEPSLVLADEPTANLDTETGGDLLDLMHELNEDKNITFLFSSHDPNVMEHATRIIELKDGRIVSDE
jgi:putative ABC transport system ATP-binding protein